MPLFSTIAHTPATRVRGSSRKVAWLIAGALVVAAVIGADIGATVPKDTAAIGGGTAAEAVQPALSHDEFVRLNTTALEYVAPTVPVVAGAPAAVDPFIYWNTTALDELAAGLTPKSSNAATEEFLEMNIASLEFSASPDPTFDRFFELNVTSLEYPVRSYSESASGPR